MRNGGRAVKKHIVYLSALLIVVDAFVVGCTSQRTGMEQAESGLVTSQATKEETSAPTVTTAPVATTEYVEITLPTETTAPPQTTAPSATQPPATEPQVTEPQVT